MLKRAYRDSSHDVLSRSHVIAGTLISSYSIPSVSSLDTILRGMFTYLTHLATLLTVR